jgi:alpha-glucosidase (family GH31 glycosyl hydrolase)
VGAFYPFSRNHNGGQVPQEPYVFNKTAMDEMRTAIKLKYSLIRYYYTLLTDNSLRGTGTIYKPVFFEFPEDKSAYSDIEYNIMIGSGLKVSINSYDLNSTYTPFYFPAGTWCLLGGKANTTNNCFNSTSGVTLTLPSTLSDYQMHIREGYIIPMQDTLSASAKNFTTSKDLQNWEVDFHLLGSVTTNN